MPLRVLLVTDAFPPTAGGSGWSTYELARGLRARGDEVIVARPRPGRPAGVRTAAPFDGFAVHEIGAWAPAVPFVRNYFKNERLTRVVTPVLRRIVRDAQVDVVHGQHLLSTPAAIAAAAAERVASVATIRDYWPVCYWSDLIHDYRARHLCPACSLGAMTRCIRPRAGAAWPAALPFVPYMQANLRWKRRALARAGAIIAVSHAIAGDLKQRAPELARHPRLRVIPNAVALDAVAEAARAPHPEGLPASYAIYVGKLAPNKGVAHLVPAATRAGLRWPLVIVGDGPDRALVERQARDARLDIRFTGWLDRAEALALVARASMLLFPSHGPESLSRVLLEASALGVPIAAMHTGGTADIITDEETGLLSADADGLARDIARLMEDEPLRRRLGAAARAHVERNFAAPAVAARVAALYDEVIAAARGQQERHA